MAQSDQITSVGKPKFFGKIESTPVIRLFAHIAIEGSAGSLSVANDQEIISIFYGAGAPIFVATNNPRVRIGTQLVNAGKLTHQQLEDALRQSREKKYSLMQYLIMERLVEASDAFELLTKQALDRMVIAAKWDVGSYAFYNDIAPPMQMMPLKIHRYKVLKNVAMRAYSNERAISLLKQWGEYIPLQSAKNQLSLREHIGFTADEVTLLESWCAAKLPLSVLVSSGDPRIAPLLLIAISAAIYELQKAPVAPPPSMEIKFPVIEASAPPVAQSHPVVPATANAPQPQPVRPSAPAASISSATAPATPQTTPKPVAQPAVTAPSQPVTIKAPPVEKPTTIKWPAEIPKAAKSLAVPLPELLLNIFRCELTGTITIQNDKRSKTAYFFKGIPFHVDSSKVVEAECLGQMLLKMGRLDSTTLHESLKRMKESGKKQGEILIEMGKLTQGELLSALKMQTEVKLMAMFDIEDPEYAIKEELPPDKRPMYMLNVGQLIFKTTVAKLDSTSAKKRLDSFPPYVIRTKVPLFDRSKIKIGIKEQKLLDECIDGSRKLEEVLKISPVLRTQAVRTIYAFWLLGMIDFRPTPEAAKVADHHLAALDEFLHKLKEGTPYDTLGIHWSSYQEMVEEAYKKRRSRFMSGGYDYHEGEPEAKKLAEEITKLIDAAYEKINTHEKRAALRKELIEDDMIMRTADLMLEKALLVLDLRADYHESLPLFKALVEIQPKVGINWAGLGVSLLISGNVIEGRRALDKGAALAGNDPRVQRLVEKGSKL